MAIRFTKKYNHEIARNVKSYNAKVRRLQKKGYDYLPQTVSVRDLKAQFDTRVSLNRELRRLKMFLAKGGEQRADTIVPMTVSEYQNIKKSLAVAKRIRTNFLKHMETATGTVLGKKMDASFKQMGFPQYGAAFRNRELLNVNIKTASLQSLTGLKQRIKNSLEIKSRQEQFRENMILKLRTLAAFGNGDPEKMDEIITALENMNINDFSTLFNEEALFNDIKSILPTNPSEFDEAYFSDIADTIQTIEDNALTIIHEYENM